MYRVANNCGQHSLDKNSYFIPSFSCFTSMIGSMKGLWIFWVKYQKDEHCIFILLIFIKGANISGGHCSFTYSQPLICRSPGLSLALSSLFCLSKTCLLLTSFCNIGSLLFHYWHILSLSFPPLVPYVHFRWLPFLWLQCKCSCLSHSEMLRQQSPRWTTPNNHIAFCVLRPF